MFSDPPFLFTDDPQTFVARYGRLITIQQDIQNEVWGKPRGDAGWHRIIHVAPSSSTITGHGRFLGFYCGMNGYEFTPSPNGKFVATLFSLDIPKPSDRCERCRRLLLVDALRVDHE